MMTLDQLIYINSFFKNYGMTSTRPNIAFTIGKLSQFSHNLWVKHQVALDQVIQYLCGGLKLDLVFNNSEGINPIRFADTTYADSSENRKLTHGMTLLIENSTCIWISIKQSSISSLTTKAKYVAQCQALK